MPCVEGRGFITVVLAAPVLAIARSQLCPGSECVAESIGPFFIDNSVDDSPLLITVVPGIQTEAGPETPVRISTLT